jgi:hypothetical protein
MGCASYPDVVQGVRVANCASPGWMSATGLVPLSGLWKQIKANSTTGISARSVWTSLCHMFLCRCDSDRPFSIKYAA